MTKTTIATAATALFLFSLYTPSYAQEARRSLRSGMAESGESKLDGTLHTKPSSGRTKGAAQNSFYDLEAFTPKEKDEMIDLIYSLRDSKDSIDWDSHRDNYEEAVKQSRSRSQPSSDEQPVAVKRNLQSDFDGDVFDGYEYSRGNCPNPGSLGVPCAPDNLPLLCNKYNLEEGSFRKCFDACKDAFCCIHNAPRDLNEFSPNCNTDENCPQYNWCYIAWWKLQDTIGPALFLRIEQNADEWFDIDNTEIESDVTNDPFFVPFYFHWFGDSNQVVEDGTEETEDGSDFDAERIFLDEDYWDYKPEY